MYLSVPVSLSYSDVMVPRVGDIKCLRSVLHQKCDFIKRKFNNEIHHPASLEYNY